MSRIAAWRQELDAADHAANHCAPDAPLPATPHPEKPADVVTCLECNGRGTLWIQSSQKFFSAPRCLRCAERVVAWLVEHGATDVKIEKLGYQFALAIRTGDASVIALEDRPVIGGLDLIQLGKEILDGVIGGYDTERAYRSLPALRVWIRSEVESRTHLRLTAMQMADVDFAAMLAKHVERRRRDAEAADIAARVHRVRGIA